MIDEIVYGYAVAVAEDAREASRLHQVQSEVRVFYSALDASDLLRQALSDPAVSAVDRRGIVADLLVGRADEEVASLFGFVVRVVSPYEVPAIVAELSAYFDEVAVSGGETVDIAPPAGRVSARARVRGYAERVLQRAPGTVLDEVEDELFRFARVLESNPSLRQVLEDPNYPLDARLGVLSDLVGAKIERATLRLLGYVLRAGRVRNLVGAYDRLVELVATERGRRVAEVRSAVELSDTEIERLEDSLGRLVGREVEVRVVIDSAVIGGVMISTGDLFIDGTVRLRFERLRDQFAQRL